MDFLKKAQSAMSGSSSNTTQAPAAGQPVQNKDYGDKALDFLGKKMGHSFTPEQGEKITDTARGLYEKQTGKKVDPKYSN